jgi:CHAD domain-containing protein
MSSIRFSDNPFLRLQREWQDGLAAGYILPPSLTIQALINALQAHGCQIERVEEERDALRYYDTQDGRIFAGGRRLFYTEAGSDWVLDDGSPQPQSAEGADGPPAEGPFGEALRHAIGEVSLIWFMDASCEHSIITVSRNGSTAKFMVQRASVNGPAGKKRAVVSPSLSAESPSGAPSVPSAYDLIAKFSRNPRPSGDLLSRGLTLLGLPFPGTPLSRKYRIGPGDSLHAALEKIAMLQIYRIWANAAGTLLNLDPEYLHDMRVAMRRLRSALRFLREFFDEYFCAYLRSELSWAAGLLGEVRDMDVLMEVIEKAMKECSVSEASSSEVLKRLTSTHAEDRKALKSAIRSKRYAALMSKLFNFVEHAYFKQANAGDDLKETASRIIRKIMQRCDGAMNRVEASLTDESMHRLRIAMKHLRYACEFFTPLFDQRIRQIIKKTVRFQDCLGIHQDSIVAIRKLGAVYFDIPMKVRNAGVGACIAALIDGFKNEATSRKGEFLRMRDEYKWISATTGELTAATATKAPEKAITSSD